MPIGIPSFDVLGLSTIMPLGIISLDVLGLLTYSPIHLSELCPLMPESLDLHASWPCIS
ncbi:hypothetical protein RHMOL_Rhmol06G0198800 [Rhododendron molle]|nr:hypothetical protein RHMOL_Rhmol06G0198800 [Rhododendron molle]